MFITILPLDLIQILLAGIFFLLVARGYDKGYRGIDMASAPALIIAFLFVSWAQYNIAFDQGTNWQKRLSACETACEQVDARCTNLTRWSMSCSRDVAPPLENLND